MLIQFILSQNYHSNLKLASSLGMALTPIVSCLVKSNVITQETFLQKQ